jgi:hypothetical protein
MSTPPTVAHSLFRPGTVADPRRTPPSPSVPDRGVRGLVRAFYRDSVAWTGLAFFSLVLTYLGGAVMFWFHALYLGEGGPAISPWLHWALDSSAGCIGLTIPIAVILPISAWVALDRNGRINAGLFSLVGGVLLALTTAPAPLFHNNFLARGTWLAERITALVGSEQYAAPPDVHEHGSALFEMAQQVVAGIPTYVPLMFIALLVARGVIRLAQSSR